MLAVLAALVVLAAGCGGGSSTSAGSGTTAGPGTATTAGSSGGTSRPQREYPGGGPTDPVFPPDQPAYSLLASGQCSELLADTQTWDSSGVPDQEGASTTPLYMSAAYACLGRWDDALRTYAQINPGSPDFKNHTCARSEILQWLTPLIDARRQDPNFSPVFVKSSGHSPCPPDQAESSSTESPSTLPGESTTTTSIESTTSTG